MPQTGRTRRAAASVQCECPLAGRARRRLHPHPGRGHRAPRRRRRAHAPRWPRSPSARCAGELDFAESLRERVATLAGLPSACSPTWRQDPSDDGVPSCSSRPSTPPAASSASSPAGSTNCSTRSPPPRARRVAREPAGGRDGVLTGRILVGPVIDAAGKAGALREWAAAHGVAARRTVAIGDGANDLAMMDIAALSVAFNAKPPVRERANVAVVFPTCPRCLRLLGAPRLSSRRAAGPVAHAEAAVDRDHGPGDVTGVVARDHATTLATSSGWRSVRPGWTSCSRPAVAREARRSCRSR